MEYKKYWWVVALFVILSILTGSRYIYAEDTVNKTETASPSNATKDEFKLADKQAQLVNADEKRYKVSLTVPGLEEDPIENNVVIVLDASDSQGGNWDSVKESILSIGDSVLNETSRAFNNTITIIGFGISDKIVAQDIVSYSQLEELLEELPNNNAFLYGRSGTNCEVGITSTMRYLESLDELDGAYIIYASDSASNMDEELVAWETWTENKSWHWGNRTTEVLCKMLIMDYEYSRILSGGEPVDATTEVFGWSFDYFIDTYISEEILDEQIEEIYRKIAEIYRELGIEASPSNVSQVSDTEDLQEELDELEEKLEFLQEIKADYDSNGYNGEVTDDNREWFIEQFEEIGLYSTLKNYTSETEDDVPYYRIWADKLWEDVYEEYGLTWGEGIKYPVSYIEHAFVDYDKEHDSNIQDSFYTAIVKYVFEDVHSKPKTKGLRAARATDELAEMSEVRKIYMIGYGSSASDSWMNPDRATKYETENYIKSDKVGYYHVDNIKNLSEALKDICPDIINTMYNDVQVTDNMSKWVTLDFDSIRVYQDDELICRYVWNEETETGECVWVIPEEERPTHKEAITVDIVKIENYEEAGDDVIGNQHGDIYKIIWNVKDGTLYSTDNYSLRYEVLIDTEEPGYTEDYNYPTNGKTYVEYVTDEGEEVQTEYIEVPVAERPTEEYREPETTESESESVQESESTSESESELESESESIIESTKAEEETSESIKETTEEVEKSTEDIENTSEKEDSDSTSDDSANQRNALGIVDDTIATSESAVESTESTKESRPDDEKLESLPDTGGSLVSIILNTIFSSYIYSFGVSI